MPATWSDRWIGKQDGQKGIQTSGAADGRVAGLIRLTVGFIER